MAQMRFLAELATACFAARVARGSAGQPLAPRAAARLCGTGVAHPVHSNRAAPGPTRPAAGNAPRFAESRPPTMSESCIHYRRPCALLNRPDRCNPLTLDPRSISEIEKRSFRVILVCVVATGASITLRAAAGKDEVKRVGAATAVLNEMMQCALTRRFQAAILEKAEAIAIFPGVKKAGFVVGGQWGRGHHQRA